MKAYCEVLVGLPINDTWSFEPIIYVSVIYFLSIMRLVNIGNELKCDFSIAIVASVEPRRFWSCHVHSRHVSTEQLNRKHYFDVSRHIKMVTFPLPSKHGPIYA